MLLVSLLLVMVFSVLAILIKSVLRNEESLPGQEGDEDRSSGLEERRREERAGGCCDGMEARGLFSIRPIADLSKLLTNKLCHSLSAVSLSDNPSTDLNADSGPGVEDGVAAAADDDDEKKQLSPPTEILADARTNKVKKMSTNEGEARPSFLVGDQEEPGSPLLSNGNQDEDRDLFNQNYSQKPSAFDLAEKRKRLR